MTIRSVHYFFLILRPQKNSTEKTGELNILENLERKMGPSGTGGREVCVPCWQEVGLAPPRSHELRRTGAGRADHHRTGWQDEGGA